MLSDPLAVTYDGVAKTLPRSTGVTSGVTKRLGVNFYRTADGEFVAKTARSLLANGSFLSSIELGRTTPDADSDPFNGDWSALPNFFGLTYTVNPVRYATSVDIPRLRTALLALVDTSLQARLISGEL